MILIDDEVEKEGVIYRRSYIQLYTVVLELALPSYNVVPTIFVLLLAGF